MSLPPLDKMFPKLYNQAVVNSNPPIILKNCRLCEYLIATSSKDDPTCKTCQAHKLLNTKALTDHNLKLPSKESDGGLLSSSGDSKSGGRKNKKNKKRENQKKQKDVVKRKKENPKNDVKRKRKRVKKSNLIIKI